MWWPRKRSQPPVLRPQVEALEPRILYSADLGAGLIALATPGPAAQTRTLDGSDDFAAASDASSVATQAPLRELVFVDAAVADRETLLADLESQKAAGRDIEIIEIGADDDGISLITAALAARDGIDAVHLLTHGGEAQVRLGNTVLSEATQALRSAEIGGWRTALSADADLLIYGCDVGAGEDGRALVAALAALTGADVAASIDATGAALLEGNWVLEQRSGAIEAGALLSATAQADWQATLALLASDQIGRASCRERV